MNTAVARRTKTKPAVSIPGTAFAIPALKKGERYVGAIIGPDGRGVHVILLAGDQGGLTWSAAIDWAKKQGGDLPDRVEQALLFKHHRDQFERDWYWSNTQAASDERWAWSQHFSYGYQTTLTKDYERWAWCQGFTYGSQATYSKGNELRARAVRRAAI